MTFSNQFVGLIVLLLSLSLVGCQPRSAQSDKALPDTHIRVSTQAEFETAVKSLNPGQTLVLANGQWPDFEILFEGIGTEDAPIRLTAETPGQVLLTGQSNLRLAGEYLEVSGLVFKEGYTPTQEVISFRKDADNLANYSRVTETVIDNFNPPERQEADFWVMLYGKHNRFDHNHLVGKRNKGVTLAVRLNTPESQENYHLIDHNYFGPRPILGSNGGETLRIGTSHHSLSDSHTLVENNYFDRADGELEIISSKSGRNVFKNNTFFESRGTLTMRHGNNTLIEDNVFFGNGVDHTGGIRVINAGQTVRNNYMEGLTGTRFGGAFVIMNGVPNSPINRYHQVKNAVIENNTIINSHTIQLGAGSDSERSAVPVDSQFSANLIAAETETDMFTVYDDMSGIRFEQNLVVNAPLPTFSEGFAKTNTNFTRADDGLLMPSDMSIIDQNIGITRDQPVTTKEMTGVTWYPKTDPIVEFGSGRTMTVTPSETALYEAVRDAQAGDVILLSPGDYAVSKFLKISVPLTIMAAKSQNSESKVTLRFSRSTLFQIEDGGSLQLKNLHISGVDSPDYAGNSVIRTSLYSMLENYRLDIEKCHFSDLDVNRAFDVVRVSKNTFADNITITGSSFETISGHVLSLDRETDDYGIYNAEYLAITDSRFKDIGGDIVDFYRGGRDESTFGPHFELTGSYIENVGRGNRNATASSLYLHGVQVTHIHDNDFIESAPFLINHTVGEPKTRIAENRFKNTAAPRIFELNSDLENTALIIDNQGL